LSQNLGVPKRGKCSICGQIKSIFYEHTSESNPSWNTYYCEGCYNHSKEKLSCPNCGEEFTREYMPKHMSDMHTTE
jgi:rRNA maturation endonuclease Nob1